MIRLIFHGELAELLTAPQAAGEVRTTARGASIKDMVEACGIPHTEVGKIAAGQSVNFSYIPADDERLDIFPLTPPVDITIPTCLRPEPFTAVRFIIDVNVAKLARRLRMLGFDALLPADHDDANLARLAAAGRILLTRDRRLLKRRQVLFGRLIRATDPQKQLLEVLNHYGLQQRALPFSRCLNCNEILQPVAKEKIIHRLEPLTKKYYTRFKYCPACDQIYWAGSHREKMQHLVEQALPHAR
ncbi:Mut7-C RNAse domain-containing protein [Desulfurivibrio alkaliphilus]|uniref:Twitching motility protein PilT n=1 Tax=Desulfurivibrio alkaliphilus (strain DSM 19089 / UNIQEM U267 / AHT2) TaxID=589865 RepID=D6Z5Z7_DESAT|nr:Mut7-C RNAse domain-containing protein [Desulfurivibrio alkaliphilus]ADH84879.1 protein of unknown function DUF82 [Desulfurivibrio alkaliphilus AHT 2]